MKRFAFRAWDLIEKKMDEVSGLDNTGSWERGWDVHFEHGGPDGPFNPNVVIMQWTGLFDQNNKMIYEGDIVKAVDEHPALLFNKDAVNYTAGKVMWIRSGFSVGQRTLGSVPIGEFTMCDCCPCALEVIGNIYENEELIKEKKNEVVETISTKMD